MAWKARLRRFLALSPEEAYDLFRAQWALLYAQLLVRTRPAGRMLEIGEQPRSTASLPEHEVVARRLSRAVSRAAHHGVFRPTCLVRAVALQRMLQARGVHGSRICVGVQLEQENFTAHAWVEYGDLLLGDDVEHVGRFTALTNAELARQR